MFFLVTGMAVKGLTTLGEHARLFEVVRMRSVHMIIDGLNIYTHSEKLHIFIRMNKT